MWPLPVRVTFSTIPCDPKIMCPPICLQLSNISFWHQFKIEICQKFSSFTEHRIQSNRIVEDCKKCPKAYFFSTLWLIWCRWGAICNYVRIVVISSPPLPPLPTCKPWLEHLYVFPLSKTVTKLSHLICEHIASVGQKYHHHQYWKLQGGFLDWFRPKRSLCWR